MEGIVFSNESLRSRATGEMSASTSSDYTESSESVAPSLAPTRASPLHVVKQSVEADLRGVQVLETAISRALFGDLDVASYIEKGVCKSLFNKEHELVAFMAVQDHPNIAIFKYCSWVGWLRRYYRMFNASSWNTLFIHHLVWDSRYPQFFVNYLKHFYKNMVHLQQILLVVPPSLKLPDELVPHFTPLFPRDNGMRVDERRVSRGVGQVVYLNLRHSVLKKLTVRKAGEEDNIDVQPILHCQHEVLQRVFGDFHLGSIINLDDTSKSVIVAEASGVTVGVMSVTAEVNYQHVSDFFFMPLPEFNKVEDSSRGAVMRQEQPSPVLAVPDDDLQSLNTDAFDKENERDQDDSDYDSYEDHQERSTSTIYLMDDEDSEFRIVDPAMQYLMSKKDEDEGKSGSESMASAASMLSLDFNTYYGRPSWSYRIPRSPSDQSVLKDRETLKELTLPTFTGPEDGFQITLYAFHPDLDVRYAFDLLEASFECYLDKSYCLLSLPTFYQACPLTKHFVRLTPRLSRDFPHELYLAHRNSIFSEFSVRSVSLADLEDISELIKNISQNRKIRRDLVNLLSEDDTSTLGYVLECEECVVGVAVVSKNFVLQHMDPHYKLEEMIRLKQYGWEGHGLLRHAVVSVLFLRAGSFFLRQIMQKAGLSTLSCCMFPPETAPKVDTTIPTVLEVLAPVRPRERVKYDLAALDVYFPEDFVLQQDQEFALFVATEKLLSVPIQELSYRVVVVGASDTALSFLENLIFRSAKKHIRYNNLTLVSVHGLPLELRPHNAGDRMSPNSGLYTRDYLSRLSLQTHINVLYGVVSDINRREKMICLNDSHWLRYDYLFLFTGVQFCRPVVGESQRKSSDLSGMTTTTNPDSGENLFLVNTTADATIALGGLKRIISTKRTGKTIVYGNSINVFSCVESLIVFGEPGQKILLVESPDICKKTD